LKKIKKVKNIYLTIFVLFMFFTNVWEVVLVLLKMNFENGVGME